MEVILLERIKKLGLPGEVVEVKGGFARNFLIPQGKALRANENNRIFFEAKKAEINAENKKKLEAAKKIASNLNNCFVTLIRQAGEDGRLYGSVSSRDIAEQAKALVKHDIKHTDIVSAAIKYIGVHKVEVDLHADINVSLNVIVAKTDVEASDLKTSFLTGDKEEKEAVKLVDKVDNNTTDETQDTDTTVEEE